MQDDPEQRRANSTGRDVRVEPVLAWPSNAPARRWYLHVEGNTRGPYMAADLERLVRDRHIRGTDFVCPEGGSDWTEIAREPAFRGLFAPPVRSDIRSDTGVQAAASDSSSLVYAAKSATQWRAGLLFTAFGLVSLFPLWQVVRWLSGGPMPSAGTVFAALAVICFPIGILAFLNALRGLPRLTTTPQGMRLDSTLISKWANWDSLEPFDLKSRIVGRRNKTIKMATAKVVGGNASKGALRAKKITLGDAFMTPLETVVADLNRARARAIGAPEADVPMPAEIIDPPIGLASFRLPWLTFALLAVLIGVFVLEIKFAITPGVRLTPTLATLLAMGALSHQAIVSGGEWYRLFTAPLLHANLAHIAGNGVALLLGGWLLERLVGRLWFFAFFVVGALGGSLLSLAIGPSDLISVGASGALMGLFAALFVGSFRHPSGAATRIGLQVNSLRVLVPSLLPLFSSSSVGRIDYGAHFGGAIAGSALAAVLVLKFWPKTERLPQLRKLAAGISIAGAIAFAVSAGFVVVNFPQYNVAIIPQAELPKTAEDNRARAAALVKRYPEDPRSHLYLSQVLAVANDNAGAERELRLALAKAEAHSKMFGPQTALAMRAVLAIFLAEQNKRDEAKELARPVCAAPPIPGNQNFTNLQKGLTSHQLCD